MRAALWLVIGAMLARGDPQLPGARQAEVVGDLPAAERAYEAELKARPSAAAWQRLGLVRHLQNKFDAAIPALREAVRLDPSLWTSHLFLGICLYRTNQFAAALSSLEQADRLAKGSPPGREEVDYWLGATRIALKQPLAGLQSLERLLARNPKHVAALELAVRTYSGLGSALWNEVAERQFESAPGYEVHGQALESEGNLEGALEAYRQSKTLNPRRAGPGMSIGRLLLRQGKALESLAALREELSLAPADPETSYYAGLAAIQMGRYAEAAPLIETAARWARRYPEAPLALAQVYLALRDPAKAIGAARRAVDAAPRSPAAHELLVAALEQAGQKEDLAQEQRRWQEQARK
ncbi:MAG: tetratricopeptide repeat protein [Acidobacteria bacterium]|nr:tetratricopeptide repeat protein [Acidobacteriota bacterium]